MKVTTPARVMVAPLTSARPRKAGLRSLPLFCHHQRHHLLRRYQISINAVQFPIVNFNLWLQIGAVAWGIDCGNEVLLSSLSLSSSSSPSSPASSSSQDLHFVSGHKIGPFCFWSLTIIIIIMTINITDHHHHHQDDNLCPGAGSVLLCSQRHVLDWLGEKINWDDFEFGFCWQWWGQRL